jgi:hypothetical protein
VPQASSFVMEDELAAGAMLNPNSLIAWFMNSSRDARVAM